MADLPVIHAPIYAEVGDWTFYCEAEAIETEFETGVPEEFRKAFQWDGAVCLKDERISPKASHTVIGRLNLSRSYAGRNISCTFRPTGEIRGSGEPRPKPARTTPDATKLSGYNPTPPAPPSRNENPPSDQQRSSVLSRPKFLNSLSDLCDVICKRVFPNDRDLAAETPRNPRKLHAIPEQFYPDLEEPHRGMGSVDDLVDSAKAQSLLGLPPDGLEQLAAFAAGDHQYAEFLATHPEVAERRDAGLKAIGLGRIQHFQ